VKLIPLLVAAGFLFSGFASAQSGADLAKSKNCMGCHDLDKKKVGPGFKEVAAKYKGNKDAEAKLIGQLKEGKGHPIKIAASDAELKTLVQYVLSQK
jgi:cytochrome c